MWPAIELEESRPVKLVVGREKKRIEGLDTSFLATISPVFRAMFYDGFAEAQQDTIEFPECDACALKCILYWMKYASFNDMSVEEKIEEIIKPKLYPTLAYFQIGSNLERCLLTRMRYNQLEEYTTLAEQSGNKWLLKAVEWKSLTFFLKYRRTEAFKKKTSEELVAYLSHPYLEYRVEKEVLEAGLFWLNYDFKQRKVHMREVFSSVNWNRITKSQLKGACCLKMLRKSKVLRDFIHGIYEIKANKLDETDLVLKGYKWAAEMFQDKTRKKRKYLLSVPFAFRETPEDIWTYGICIYNSKTEKFKDQIFLMPRDIDNNVEGFVDAKFFDFHFYAFLRVTKCGTDELDRGEYAGFQIQKISTRKEGPQKWKYLEKYGQYVKRPEMFLGTRIFEQLSFADDDLYPFKNENASVVPRGTKMIITYKNTDTFDMYKESITPGYEFDAGNHGHTKESVAREHTRKISHAYNPPSIDAQRAGSSFENADNVKSVCAAFAKTIETPQSLQIFRDKLKIHVDSKINKNTEVFEVAENLVQHVNPLWFKKFP